MVDGVGDEQVTPHLGGDGLGQEQQPLRLVEDLGRAPTGALGLEVALEVDDLVVGRVRDDNAAVGQGDELAGEGQGRLPRRRRHIRRITPAQGPLLAVLGDELVDERGQSGPMALSRHRGDDVALRVENDQRGPGARGVGLPGRQLGVVEHRVVHGIPLHGRLDGGRIALVLELRRVDPDEDELVGELALDRPQLVEHVEAVDAAERPEVQDDDPSAQALQRQLSAAGVEPAPPDELGGAHPGAGTQGCRSGLGRHVVGNTGGWAGHSVLSAPGPAGAGHPAPGTASASRRSRRCRCRR